MSEELMPCPFCGGEASIESGRYWKAEKWMEVDE